MKDNMTEKKIEVQFAPGCFDDFEGTQEELAELVVEIQRLAESGDLFEESNLLDVEELSDAEYERMQIAASKGRNLQ